MKQGTILKQWAGSILLATLTSMGATTSFAQSDAGSVIGTIEDASGAVIPGTTIKLTNTDTNAVQVTTTDASGDFKFPALQRGNYKVEASHDGFQTAVQAFLLEVSHTQAIDLHLAPGSVATVVQVTDAAPLVDTSTSSMSETIQGRQVTELPLNGRNFTQLALLTPGVTRGNYGNGASGVNGDAETFRNSESGGGSLSTNGLRPQANNFILDGIDNNESLVNTLDFFPNIEGTEEFRVNTSTAPAEFGRAGGSIVQSSIKSGTNQIHGSAFEFGRSSLFDANPNHGFIGAPPTKALPFKRNTFGGSLGGPLWKNHVFLFGDYQGLRESQPLNAQVLTVPTAQMRTGDFSQLLTSKGVTHAPTYVACPGLYGNDPNNTTPTYVDGAIYNPVTCSPFTGNIIPTSQLNQAAVNYLNAYPLPNVPGSVNGTENNYQTVRNRIQHANTFDVRADANLSAADRAFARFVYDNSNFTLTSEFPNLPAGFASGQNFVHGRGYAIGETHTFSPSVINEFHIGYNRYTFANVPVFSGVPISANLGIVNANRNANLGGGALIGGNNNQLEYTGDYGTYKVPENTYEINDAVTVSRAKNTFKFGASGIRRDVAYFRPISGKGYFQIGNGDFTGYEPSELLAGFIDNYSIGAQSGFYGTRNYEVGAFAEDDYKLNQRLTLNLGFRYDVITWPTEEHNRQSALNPNTGTIELAGVNGVSRTIINNNYGNYAPRIGFAYDAFGTGKTVLRGGYGIYYFLDRGGIDNQLGQQVPFGGSTSYTAAQGYRITFTGEAPNGQNSNANATKALPAPGVPPGFDPNNPPAGINIFAVNKTEKLPSVQQYDMQLQQQIGNSTVITVGYVGNKGDHLSTGYNYNTKPLGTPASQANAFPNLGQVVLNQTNGVSHYNSFQAQLNYHATNSLVFTSSYTWSHNIDDTDGFLGFYAVSPLYVYNDKVNKGNSSLDQRNVFVASALYDLPFGHGHMFGNNWNRGLELAAGGWQFNTIVTAETGSPFTVLQPVYGGGYSLRANETGGNPVTHSVLSQPYLRVADFAAPAAGTEGNTGRNQFYGPGLAEGDVSLFKTLHFTDRFASELRAEVYNVTNTPAFTNPDANVTDGTFGQITGTRQNSERQMQMAVRFLF